MKKTKKIGILFIVLAFIFTFMSKTIYNLTIPNVTATMVKGGKLSSDISVYSVVKSNQSKTVYSLYDGTINTVLINENDTINNGETILNYDKLGDEYLLQNEMLELKKLNLKIDNSNVSNNDIDYQINLSSLESELNKFGQNKKNIEIEIENKKTDYDNAKKLYDNGVISKNELKNYEQTYNEKVNELTEIETDIENLKDEISLLKKNKENYDLQAEHSYKNEKELLEIEREQKQNYINLLSSNIEKTKKEISTENGLISKIYIKDGQTISKNTQLFDVSVNTNEYEAVFDITNDEANTLDKEKSISLLFKTDKTNEIECTNFEIKNGGDTNNTKKLVARFIYDESNLDGQTVILNHKSESAYYDFIVPNNAIKYDGKNYYVLDLNKEEDVLGTKYFATKKIITILDKGEENSAIMSINGFSNPIIVKSNKFINDMDRVYYEIN